MCLLASAYLCSGILENNIGISSEFLRGMSLPLFFFVFFFCVEVILQDFEDLIYPQGSQAHIGFGYFVVRMILNL